MYKRQTVTCIKNIHQVNIAELRNELGKSGLEISNGYGKLKDKTFRIAHMGDLTLVEIEELLSAIDQYLFPGGEKNK